MRYQAVMDFEATLRELQGPLGKQVFVGVGAFELGSEGHPAVVALLGELRRAATGRMWTAPPGAEHVAFDVGDIKSPPGGFFVVIKESFKTADWVDGPDGRELAIVQDGMLITVGDPPPDDPA
jgi:hypothetical protein